MVIEASSTEVGVSFKRFRFGTVIFASSSESSEALETEVFRDRNRDDSSSDEVEEKERRRGRASVFELAFGAGIVGRFFLVNVKKRQPFSTFASLADTGSASPSNDFCAVEGVLTLMTSRCP